MLVELTREFIRLSGEKKREKNILDFTDMEHYALEILICSEQDVEDDFTYDTSKMEAFEAPAGAVLEFYGTTLHYAPCNGSEEGFRVAIVLPKDTNLPLDEKHAGGEDKHLTAKNKWLIGHPEGGLPEGSPMGLIGENVRIK